MNRCVRDMVRELEAVGATIRYSSDGHAKVYSRQGRFVAKIRTHGSKTGDSNGATGRSILAQYKRKVVSG